MTADIPCITTVPGASAAVMGIEATINGQMQVRPLQDLHAQMKPRSDLGAVRAPRAVPGRGRGRGDGARVDAAPAGAALLRTPGVSALASKYGTDNPVEVFGVRFPNPVGLAAGMDKNGIALPAWPALGFGFVEVGTVTAKPQPGNEKPRVFRLRESAAIINRMGFNNEGAAGLAARLGTKLPVPLGISSASPRSRRWRTRSRTT